MKNNLFPIVGFEKRYVINEAGDVYRINRIFQDKINRTRSLSVKKLTCFIGRSGYPSVALVGNNDRRGSQYLHRLLAFTFIPKPKGKDFVNHKNGNKQDSRLENLEWVTFKENWLHAVANNLIKLGKVYKIPVKNICNGKIYASILEASKDMGINYNVLKKDISSKKFKNSCLRKIRRNKYDYDISD